MLRRRSNDALAAFAGNWLDGATTAAEAVIASVEFNGANSAIRKNSGTAATGDSGSGGLTSGLTIGNISDADADELVTTWSLVSGPAPISIVDPSAVATTASFSAPGTYLLRLTAFDGL